MFQQDTEMSMLLFLRDQVDSLSLADQFASSSAAREADAHQALGSFIYQSLHQHATSSQSDLLRWLERETSVKRTRPFMIANVIAVDCVQCASLLDRLFNAFGGIIEHVESNKPFPVQLGSLDEDDTHGLLFQNGPDSTQGDISGQGWEEGELQWNLQWVHVPQVWNASGRGEGFVYANADTGVLWEHEILRGNYLGLRSDDIINHNYAWFDGVKKALKPGVGPCGINSTEPCDDNGHGTHTTSTAVGSKGYGVAPGSKWMACRNMDRGFGSSESYLTCLEFFLAPTDLGGRNPDPTRRPHAIGNSYGCPSEEGCSWNTFTQAVKAIRAAGIFMSVSAGNEGPSCSTVGAPPGYEQSVISVGSSGFKTSTISGFSSRGPVSHKGAIYRKPDLTAPGSQVKAAYPAPSYRPGDRLTYYRSLSGTSMASPHVGSGAILLMQACPELSRNIDAIQLLLQLTARRETTGETGVTGCGDDVATDSPNNVYGWGGIDLFAAVTACKSKLE